MMRASWNAHASRAHRLPASSPAPMAHRFHFMSVRIAFFPSCMPGPTWGAPQHRPSVQPRSNSRRRRTLRSTSAPLAALSAPATPARSGSTLPPASCSGCTPLQVAQRCNAGCTDQTLHAVNSMALVGSRRCAPWQSPACSRCRLRFGWHAATLHQRVCPH